VHKSFRIVFGFLLAPLIPGILLALGACIHPDGYLDSEIPFLISMSALLGYPVALALGVPLFFLMKRCKWVKFYHYVAVGAVLGIVAAVIGNIDKKQYFNFADFSHYYLTSWNLFLGAIMGAVATTSFWLVVRPDRSKPS
jgi:hypothetical protein